MKRGRPAGSPVRKNVVELLAVIGELHGYDICKHYEKIFPTVSKRAIYYALQKGTKQGFFKVSKVESITGVYSWGPNAQRTYFCLGELAKPTGDTKVKKYAEQLPKKSQDSGDR